MDGHPRHRHVGDGALHPRRLQPVQSVLVGRSRQLLRRARHRRGLAGDRPPRPRQEPDGLVYHAGDLALPRRGVHADGGAVDGRARLSLRHRDRSNGVRLSVVLYYVQHRAVLDLRHRNLAAGDPREGLLLHDFRVGRRVRDDRIRDPDHVIQPGVEDLHRLRRLQHRLHADRLVLLPGSGGQDARRGEPAVHVGFAVRASQHERVSPPP